MKTQPRTRFCMEGFYYLAVVGLVFFGAMLREVNLLLILAGLLLGPLVLSVRLASQTLRGLDIFRKAPQRLGAGEAMAAHVTLVNPRRRLGCWAVTVEDCIRREGEGPQAKPLRPGVVFPYVPAGGQRKAAYRGTLVERGRYRIGPLKVSTRFPFGLFSRTVWVGQEETLLVVPRLGRLMPGWTARRRRALSGVRQRECRQGPEGDFYGLRRWKLGDSRRLIHWRTTARRGELMVRQFEQPQSRDVAIILDLWLPPQPAGEDRDLVEVAISFAATICEDACRRGGSKLTLITANARIDCLSGPASAGLLHEAMGRLAMIEGRSDDQAAELLRRARAEVDPDSEIVILSTRAIDLGRGPLAGIFPEAASGSGGARLLCVDVSSTECEKYFQPR